MVLPESATDTLRDGELPGPYPVGAYAAQLKRRLLEFARVQLVGEVWGFRSSAVRVYFELRDGRGALPCSMWRTDFDALGTPLVDGLRIVVGGGCDYYPGSATSSPSFTFAVTELHVEGEGDLLLQLERLRRRLAADGLFEPQKRLVRPLLPRAIGVVTGERGKARDDVLAGLRRRGWAGRLVWAFAPVQDRHAAPAIAAALRELAAIEEVQVVIVARGGGSLADLFAFCDEGLCRTVALLRVPVISSVGHHTDRTLIDDVAAVACSTPTHAAEAAVRIDCRAARSDLLAAARRLDAHGRRAILDRARALGHLSRAPRQHVARNRRHLHQLVRELRASARRACEEGQSLAGVHLLVLGRVAARTRGSEAAKRARELERLSLALAAHDPERTLARGYALVEDRLGEPLPSAATARSAGDLRIRFHDDTVDAKVPISDG
ncbi:MAG: exodeoxyribonuclease VII large subunit [Solirubrobacterales bacterium]|nr:exodeoxyribonuclease VII large subunit [Solirubrobacterales bacterium]MBV9796808.1 exodeoxyribonuclease VII large subunit [Solirubrobacterales bacterium]